MINPLLYPKLIKGGLVVVALFLVMWFVWDYRDTKADNTRLTSDIVAASQIIKQQKQNILISERVSNDYQATIDQLNLDLKRMRVKQVHCHVLASASAKPNETTSKRKLPEGNGLRSDWLREFSGRCEAERLKVIGLQNFINQTWEKNSK